MAEYEDNEDQLKVFGKDGFDLVVQNTSLGL